MIVRLAAYSCGHSRGVGPRSLNRLPRLSQGHTVRTSGNPMTEARRRLVRHNEHGRPHPDREAQWNA
ncbi:hypothetical protein GCM10009116_26500 [Brevundimonas basaltis]